MTTPINCDKKIIKLYVPGSILSPGGSRASSIQLRIGGSGCCDKSNVIDIPLPPPPPPPPTPVPDTCLEPGIDLYEYTAIVSYDYVNCSDEYHRCNRAIFDFYIDNILIGEVNLNNAEDAGYRETVFTLNEHIISSQSTTLRLQCKLADCHNGIGRVTLKDPENNIVLALCMPNDIVVGGFICPESSPTPTPTPTPMPSIINCSNLNLNNLSLYRQYLLNNSLSDSLGGPSLVSYGGSLSETGYTINSANAGLSLSDPFGSSSVENYAIKMTVKFNSIPIGYGKILDFKNRTSDTGLYLLGSKLNFYNEVTGSIDLNTIDTYQLVFGRYNGVGYGCINNLLHISFTDTYDLALLNNTNILYIGIDDTQVPGEVLQFNVSSIEIYKQIEAATPTPTPTLTPTNTVTPSSTPCIQCVLVTDSVAQEFGYSTAEQLANDYGFQIPFYANSNYTTLFESIEECRLSECAQ